MFKVGDWVVFSYGRKTPVQVDEITLAQISSSPSYIKATLWEPKEGEWCWVFDDEFRSELTNKAYKTSDGIIKTHDSCSWKHCEPFVGELPSFIKD